MIRNINRLRNRSLSRLKNTPEGVEFLFRDDFITAEAAPLTSPRTAEPGPGTGTIVDTDNKADIIGGNLQLQTHSVPAVGDPGIVSQSIARAIGLVALSTVNLDTTNDRLLAGFDDAATGNMQSNSNAFFFREATELQIFDTGGLVVGAYSSAVNYIIATILRSAGAFYCIKGGTFSDWTLIWVGETETADPVFARIAMGNLSGLTSLHNYLRVSQLPAPWDTDDGIGILVDDFNRANGTLGNADKGGAWVFDTGIWTVASNKAVGTPVLGSEELTNGDFTNWTGDNPDGWSVAGEAGTSEISEVGSGQGHGGAGNGFCNIFKNDGNFPLIRQFVLTTATWYEVTLEVNLVNSGQINVRDDASTLLASFTTTGSKLFTGRATTDPFLIVGQVNPTDITIDDVTVKQLTLDELLSSLESSEIEVLANVDVVVVAGTQAGLVTHLDSAATPANFLLAYHNQTNATLVKNVGGTYTTLIDTAATYSAGATLRVIAFLDGSDLKVRLYYNNALIGTEQTISDAGIVSNTIHGLFSTNSGNTLDGFRVWPRNIAGSALAPLDAVANA